MEFKIEKILIDRTQNISFITIKEDAEFNLKGYNIPKNGLEVPILNEDLVDVVKNDEQGIKISSIVKGILNIIGIDSKFKYNEEYKKILYLYDEKIEDYIGFKALEFAKDRKFLKGLIYLKALLYLNPNNLNGLYNYCVVCIDLLKMYSKAKDEEKENLFFEEALEKLEYIVSKHPDFALSYYNLGFLYLKNQQYIKAKLNWEDAVAKGLDDDKKVEVLNELNDLEYKVEYEEGYNLVINGHPKEGLEKLEPLLKDYSDWWNLIFFVGLAKRQLNEFDQAIYYFEKILTANENQTDTLCEIALCYASKMDLEASLEYFSRALANRPNDYEILCNIGMLYLQMNEIKKAKEYIDYAYELNPNDQITLSCKMEIEKYI